MKSFLITIDTEGDNLWALKDNEDITTENVKYLPRFQALCDKFDFKPSWLTNFEIAMDDSYVQFAKRVIKNDSGEIGMHIHAWNTPPFFDLHKGDTGLPYLIEYPEEIMERKIKTMCDVISDRFDLSPKVHRAGRWATNDKYFELLNKYGIVVDCSVTPNINWENSPGRTSNSKGSNYTGKPNTEYMVGEILEIPMTIKKTHRWNLNRNEKMIINMKKACRRSLNGQNVWLRPNGHNLNDMKWIVDNSYKNDERYIMFMLHSSELMPGGSPTFRNQDDIEKLYYDIEKLFQYISGRYVGKTLTEHYKDFNNNSV